MSNEHPFVTAKGKLPEGATILTRDEKCEDGMMFWCQADNSWHYVNNWHIGNPAGLFVCIIRLPVKK